MRRFILAVLGGLGVFGTASAQQPIPASPELLAFMQTPEEDQMVKTFSFNDWEAVMPGCTATGLAADIAVHVPPEFDASGRPVVGQWQVMLRVKGCGQTKTFNIFYSVGPEGQLTRLGMLPGTTAADPWLQRDALKYAQMAMLKLTPAGCDELVFVDTAFEALKRAPARGRDPAWTEKWTIRACSVEAVVRMHFTPDATGTQITVKTEETVRIR